MIYYINTHIQNKLIFYSKLCAKTTITADPSFTEDKMWLNGIKVDIPSNVRLNRCIDFRKLSISHHIYFSHYNKLFFIFKRSETSS